MRPANVSPRLVAVFREGSQGAVVLVAVFREGGWAAGVWLQFFPNAGKDWGSAAST